jgi:hypothetical protein
VRPDLELDPVADRRVAGAADADDPAVLDADVGLDDPDRSGRSRRAGDDASSSDGPGRPWRIRGRIVLA